MIIRKHRFHGHNSLNFVYHKGKTVRSEYVGLRYAGSRQTDYRLAVVVSRKVSKSAVVRNKIRRRIYEAVREYKKAVSREWPLDMVITVYDERPSSVPGQELRANIERLLKKAGL